VESYDADAANETIEADADATAYATGMSEANKACEVIEVT
jgi:hypothetical protein